MADLGEIVILTWFFVTGSVLGSFLNVVIYRLPRGLSLVHPPSRCPICLHPIRWHDNIPVFGWFLLRGRCRDCGAPIAKRYPLVEALAGVDALLIALSSGEWRWVPILDSLLQMGVVHPALIPTGVYIGVSLSLLAAALILFDGGRVPMSFWTTAILLVIVGSVAPHRSADDAVTPVHGPISRRSTPASPQLTTKRQVDQTESVSSKKNPDRWAAIILAIVGGLGLDLWFGFTVQRSTSSPLKPHRGWAGIVQKGGKAPRSEKSEEQDFGAANSAPASNPPRSGWEYSFACGICGWTLASTTEVGVFIAFLAAVAAGAVLLSKLSPHPSWRLGTLLWPDSAEATPKNNGIPKRIRSIPMFVLWLLFLGWVVIR
ncbi:prepilin peptidase [Thermopirellula anaerolimosa]